MLKFSHETNIVVKNTSHCVFREKYKFYKSQVFTVSLPAKYNGPFKFAYCNFTQDLTLEMRFGIYRD